jgi:hypothetical protein
MELLVNVEQMETIQMETQGEKHGPALKACGKGVSICIDELIYYIIVE